MNRPSHPLSPILPFLLAIAIAGFSGCGGRGSDTGSRTDSTASRPAETGELDACRAVQELKRSPESALAAITKGADEIMSNADDVDGYACAEALVDSLANGFVRGGKGEYLDALAGLREVSDGEISTYIDDELGASIVERAPDATFTYLFSHRETSDFDQGIVSSVASEIEDTEPSAPRKEGLQAIFTAGAGKASTPEMKGYIEGLWKQVEEQLKEDAALESTEE
jgi:hypothetical protein